MAKQSFINSKAVNIALIVIGIGIAAWGYKLSGQFSSQVVQTISGSPTDKVMMYYIVGAICAAIGLFRLKK